MLCFPGCEILAKRIVDVIYVVTVKRMCVCVYVCARARFIVAILIDLDIIILVQIREKR